MSPSSGSSLRNADDLTRSSNSSPDERQEGGPNPYKSALPGMMKEMMELKLVAEIKERTSGRAKDAAGGDASPQGGPQDPAARLVAELAAELAAEAAWDEKKNQAQANLRKVSLTGSEEKKKVDKDEAEENPGPIIDFKSRLRKVDGAKLDAEEPEDGEATEEGDDKRRSTGSISSLKKLWESKDSDAPTSSGSAPPTVPPPGVPVSDQISPKMSKGKPEVPARSPQLGGGDEQGSPEDSSRVRAERRVWPPPEEKPAVPTKPVVNVRNVKPHTKPMLPAIYATPTLPKNDGRSDGRSDARTDRDGGTKSERDSILEISQALETSLTSLKNASSVSTSSWLQLSDKVGLLHSTCMGYTDSLGPPHARFHLRELLTRLETQARQLRSAGARNSSENSRLCCEVLNTVKDVVNAVQR